LPRIAYLLDGLLHRIGLHGSSMVPLVLGYGCSVPACLATRVLPSRRDRFIASVLATLVPCSARSNVIFALVAFYLGPAYAIAVFVVNAAVVVFSGWFLSRIMPEVSPGMVLDVPRYQVPTAKAVAKKVWLRLREFVLLSWPMLIIGSLVLGLADHWHWNHAVNSALSPLTRLLGLPFAIGTTLVFGLLRKELSMIMLGQALGTPHVGAVMTHTQILVFTLFVAFYVPCLATVTSLVREIGKRMTAWVVTYTLAVATVLALLARLLGQVVFAR
jgi:ferrous iron transport protein B